MAIIKVFFKFILPINIKHCTEQYNNVYAPILYNIMIIHTRVF